MTSRTDSWQGVRVKLPPVVLVATTSRLDYDDLAIENDGFSAALDRAGISHRFADWYDPDVDWAAAAAVVIRTTWDYPEHLDAFRVWMQRLDGLGVVVLNPPATVLWNVNKRYLLALAGAGVPIVPVEAVAAGTTVGPVTREMVVKPAVGAGGIGAVRLAAGEALVTDVESLVGPFEPNVATGELAVFLIDGECVGAIRKVPSSTDWRVHDHFGGRSELDPNPPATALAAARHVFEAAATLIPGTCYLRVDLLEADDHTWRLLELEAIEPSLYCSRTPQFADALATAVAARIRAR